MLHARIFSGEDTELVQRYQSLKAQAEKSMLPPAMVEPLTYTFAGVDAVATIKGQVHLLISRVTTLAGLLRIEHAPRAPRDEVRQDPKFKQALADLLAVCAFPNWNSEQKFLDTAEMSFGVAIGYDWLYEWLNENERARIVRGLVDKGLRPGARAIEQQASWSQFTSNWAQVTRGGLAVAALAVATEDATVARPLFSEAERKLARVSSTYAPDGGWPEGAGYWNYATSYFVSYLAAHATALGTESPLLAAPGFANTGFFEIYETGPIADRKRLSIQTFDFGDDSGTDVGGALLFWLADKFHQPFFADKERLRLTSRPSTLTIFHLLWDPGDARANWDSLPLDHVFQRVNVATFRSSWSDPQALFGGFKGGVANAGHAHLDQGSFVLDALGQRWAVDLGADAYSLPSYFGKGRFHYYRTSTRGHNTITVDDGDQDVSVSSPIVAFRTGTRTRFAVADLHATYGKQLTSFKRGIAISDKEVLLQDELSGKKGGEIAKWHLHTPADVTLDGNRAVLHQAGEMLFLTIVSPEGARFALESATPTSPPGQNKNEGITDLTMSVHLQTTPVTIAVAVTDSSDVPVPALRPLDEWGKPFDAPSRKSPR